LAGAIECGSCASSPVMRGNFGTFSFISPSSRLNATLFHHLAARLKLANRHAV
jgi:hypothetical protein